MLTPTSRRISDDFRGYKSGILVENGINSITFAEKTPEPNPYKDILQTSNH